MNILKAVLNSFNLTIKDCNFDSLKAILLPYLHVNCSQVISLPQEVTKISSSNTLVFASINNPRCYSNFHLNLCEIPLLTLSICPYFNVVY
jgi:hypothetical protein